ncbi:related to gamma-tubulin complex component 2 [Sporisorium reilianum SRZ2]|uniref:Spindle pole body component n=1 Tax=Sporisorium reilianum (strain SRZ2) TaxID=999809 RepID=E6ZWS7_SPORE|nr:related to gamma-tubulin complex component 2 [Sporisorium reilianum SRZ2]
MSSARTSSSSRPPVVPATPIGRSNRRKNHLNLSAKAFDKMSKRLLSVEKSTGQSAMASWGASDPNEPLAAASHRIDGIPELGEGGHRTTASYVIAEADDNAANGPEIKTSTEYHLRRFGKAPVSRGLTQGAGKGPDGAALAAAAAKSLKGKDVAPVDSFLNEGSFVFNPLNRRVPQPTPRKAKTRTISSTNNAASSRAVSGPALATASTAAPAEPRLPSQRYQPQLDQAGPSSQPSAPAAATHQPANRPESTPTADNDDQAFVPLTLVDRDLQEALILEDLLFVLLGIEGQYVTYASTYDPEDVAHRLRGAHFTIDAALDAPLRDLVDRILPLATDYTAIYAFIETDSGLEYGTVNHALCAAIRDLLHDYELLVVQLEHQMASSTSFSLQKLFVWIQETARTLAMVRALTDEIVGISHADLFDDDDDDDDDSSDGDGASDISGTSALERERRALLGLDDPDDEGVEGGIAKGGEVLSMLWDRITRMSGDPKARTLFTTLFQRASQPYAQTLVQWITTGDLSDTYEEFMVMEDAKVTRAALESDPTDEYWETRYTLRDETTIAKRERQRQLGLDLDAELEDEEDNPRGILTGGAKIPSFLEPWKHKILLAGRYLNVIRECGLEVPSDPDEAAEAGSSSGKAKAAVASVVVMNDESFFRRIEAAYQRANSALLKLLLGDQHILERLRSLKHFFFFSESDFLSSFLEQSGHELAKKVSPSKTRETVQQRLQTHLGAVLGSSSTVGFEDPYREDVRIVLASEGAYDQLKRIAETKGGIEATKLAQANAAAAAAAGASSKEAFVPAVTLLQFDVAVKFPVSLVISRKNILRYQFVSRGLLHLKTLERALSELWLDHSSNALWKQRTHPALEKWKQKLFMLRSRMTFFVQQLLAFQMMEVVEPNYLELERKLRNVKTVDQLMKDHFAFLNTTRKELMFTDLRYLELHSQLTTVINVFVENRTRFQDQVLLETERWKQAGGRKGVAPEPALQESTNEFLGRVQRHWERYAKTYKDVVNLLSTTDNPAALPLAYRFQSSNL